MKIIESSSIYLPDGNLYLLDGNSVNSLLEMGNLNPYDLKHCDPLILQFPEDTTIRCDQTVAIDKSGNSHDVYVLGNHDDNIERLLKLSEKTFWEYVKDHPQYKSNMTLKDGPVKEMAEQYIYYLLGKVFRPNAELDAALGIKGDNNHDLRT